MNDRQFFTLVQAQVHAADSRDYRMDKATRERTHDQGNGTSIYAYPNGGAYFAQVNDSTAHVLKATGSPSKRCGSWSEAKAICDQGTTAAR